MKKLLFLLLTLFVIPVFADYPLYPSCGIGKRPMDGSYCYIMGGGGNRADYTISVVRTDSKVLVKPFVCTISSDYQSHVKGFALKYTIQADNAIFFQPTDLPPIGLVGYTEKGKSYMFKTSGGSVDDIYRGVSLTIENIGCSPYDPDCHEGNKNTEIIVSCRTLT